MGKLTMIMAFCTPCTPHFSRSTNLFLYLYVGTCNQMSYGKTKCTGTPRKVRCTRCTLSAIFRISYCSAYTYGLCLLYTLQVGEGYAAQMFTKGGLIFTMKTCDRCKGRKTLPAGWFNECSGRWEHKECGDCAGRGFILAEGERVHVSCVDGKTRVFQDKEPS